MSYTAYDIRAMSDNELNTYIAELLGIKEVRDWAGNADYAVNLMLVITMRLDVYNGLFAATTPVLPRLQVERLTASRALSECFVYAKTDPPE